MQNRIPATLVLKIASYLPLQDVFSLAQVCKSFSTAFTANEYAPTFWNNQSRYYHYPVIAQDNSNTVALRQNLKYQYQDELQELLDVLKCKGDPKSAFTHALKPDLDVTIPPAFSTNIEGHTPLDMAFRLIELGVDINTSDDQQATLIIYAALRGRTDMVVALIQRGANVNAAAIDGTTALIWAASIDEPLMAQALLKAGANPNACSLGDDKEPEMKGETALMNAASGGRNEIVNALLQAGADVFAARVDGKTALDFAEASEHFDTIKILKSAMNANTKPSVRYA